MGFISLSVNSIERSERGGMGKIINKQILFIINHPGEHKVSNWRPLASGFIANICFQHFQ